MRHRKLNTQLNRSKSHRAATLRNIVRALFTHERVRTTVKKAKVSSRFADKMITLAKKNNLAATRRAVSLLHDKDIVKKLFNEIGPRYAVRNGGYTRVVKLQNRRGDGAEIAILELTEKEIMPAEIAEPKKSAVSKSTVEEKSAPNSKQNIEDAQTVEETKIASKEQDAPEAVTETVETEDAQDSAEPKDSSGDTEDTNSKKE